MNKKQQAEMRAWFKRNYRVDAWVGRPVRVDGKSGSIVGYSGPHLLVKFEDQTLPCHPTWNVEYL